MEGFDAKNGSPSPLTLRRYKRYANGGVALIWFEATAILDNCRSNEHQLVIREDNLEDFKNLVIQTRETSEKAFAELGFENSCILILQLNHSGRYTKRNGKRYPIRAIHNSELDAAIDVSATDGQIVTDQELQELERIWVEKAILAKEAGFDGVDIKACHGYLISDLLSARLREDSAYGGDALENRARFLLNILKALKKCSSILKLLSCKVKNGIMKKDV